MTGLFFAIALFTLTARGSVPYQQQQANPSSSSGMELAIAAPDELSSALREVARRFEQKTGTRIRFTFADPVNLIKQIRAGTAFDVVFLPDVEEMRRLAVSGMVTSASITEYGRDQMVLCIAPQVHIDPRPGNPLLLLTSKQIPHIAIASPQHTAFGKATVQALTAVHIYDFELRRKFVVGADIAEVAHLLEQGNADVALLPGTAIGAYQLRRSTRTLLIPSKVYTPIRKQAAVLRHSKHSKQALDLLRFAVSPAGKEIFSDAGLDEPQRAAARRRLSK